MRLSFAPAVWMAHFLAVYVLATLVCERAAAGAAVVTLAALAAFLLQGLSDYRIMKREGAEAFVARTSLLLCALSALAVLWVAYPAFVLPACTPG
jgi:hypothetical protein